jgi:phospho-N-acetylmuramoyl-pentapeptide-transferase
MLYSLLSSNSILFSAAFATSFLLTLLFGKIFIPALKAWQGMGQPIRDDGPKSHEEKAGTPSMGGLLFIPAILIASLLFMDWSSLISWIPLIALVGFAVIGFVDDYGKIRKRNAYGGLTKKQRLFAGGLVAVGLAFLIDATMPASIPDLSVILPPGIVIPLGIFYFAWAYLVIVGTANAANITDGLDGMLSKLYLAPLAVMIIALIGITRIKFLPNLIFLPEAAALFPLFGAVFGAILGFLWYNARPAGVFMGDVGSLALGGFLGAAALLMKMEIVMAVAAMMMVLILLSSFIQIMYYKATKKRVFKMAPLHHHFELSGWAETKIVDRFFVLSIVFAGMAVALLRI